MLHLDPGKMKVQRQEVWLEPERVVSRTHCKTYGGALQTGEVSLWNDHLENNKGNIQGDAIIVSQGIARTIYGGVGMPNGRVHCHSFISDLPQTQRVRTQGIFLADVSKAVTYN